MTILKGHWIKLNDKNQLTWMLLPDTCEVLSNCLFEKKLRFLRCKNGCNINIQYLNTFYKTYLSDISTLF